VNFWYGRQKKLKSVSIGTIWKPHAGKPATTNAATGAGVATTE
jgi:preprotein translocase subunit SecD